MKRLAALVGLLMVILLTASCGRIPNVSSAHTVDVAPRLDPDYTSITIPPNIAPLNFRIKEPGSDYLVRISSGQERDIDIRCSEGTCRIPARKWRALLNAAQGKTIDYDIYVKGEDGRWAQFQRVSNHVAREPIDSYLVYRRLVPNRAFSTIKGIFQRDLESFETSALLTLRDGTFSCFNCHTFHQNNPNKFIIQSRGKFAGMTVVTDGRVRRINTKQDPMFRPLAYASWHPDGDHIAATLNMFHSFWPITDGRQDFESIEKRGDMVVYSVKENTINTTAEVFGGTHIETHPCWSADGRHIYYVRHPTRRWRTGADLTLFKSDLMRIAHDVKTGSWGKPETVKAYSELGTSCSFPRPSPCGKYVLHILADHTTYPIHQNSSDLYLLDIETKEHRRLDSASSDGSESYPRWSSNGRWFSFVSNRRDGISALPYFAYLDEQGDVHKAFVLPYEDPAYYDTFTDTYNAPELIKSKVDIEAFKLAQGMQQDAVDAEFPNPPTANVDTRPVEAPPSSGSHY